MGFGKDGKGQILTEVIADSALTTLAAKDAVAITSPIVLVDDFRILKSEVVAMVNGLTAGQGRGLVLGIASGDFSAAEIEEALEVNGPTNRGQQIENERAMRNVRILGVADPNDPASTQVVFRDINTNAPMMISKHRWTYSNPSGWDWFVYNLGGSLTTGATVQLIAKHFGVWLT